MTYTAEDMIDPIQAAESILSDIEACVADAAEEECSSTGISEELLNQLNTHVEIIVEKIDELKEILGSLEPGQRFDA